MDRKTISGQEYLNLWLPSGASSGRRRGQRRRGSGKNRKRKAPEKEFWKVWRDRASLEKRLSWFWKIPDTYVHSQAGQTLSANRPFDAIAVMAGERCAIEFKSVKTSISTSLGALLKLVSATKANAGSDDWRDLRQWREINRFGKGLFICQLKRGYVEIDVVEMTMLLGVDMEQPLMTVARDLITIAAMRTLINPADKNGGIIKCTKTQC